MDGREHQHQSLGICHRLYNLMKSLATYALKIMTSIHPVIHGSAQHDRGSRSAHVVHPMAQGTPLHEAAKLGAKFESGEQANTYEQDKGDSSSSYGPPQHVEGKRSLEQETSFSADSSQARGPKKMVSINENVETMKFIKRRSKKKEVEVEFEPTPLKSILKQSSDLNNSPGDMLINPANGA